MSLERLSDPRKNLTRSGFTIVELLIVVVVIAILAAITLVSYNGITAQARESTLKSDLTNAAKQLQLAKVGTGSFPGNTNDAKKADSTTFQYDSTADTFCLTGTSSQLSGKAFHITEGGGVQDGACDGHTVGGGDGGGGEIAANSPIQNVTPAQCQALPTFTGSNNDAVRTVTDNRGGTTRTYEIAKLADGNCWMLTNLRFGSTTGTITLTPADSDVASNFTLPQLITSGGDEYDNARAYGPVPGDTGSGVTNYGYLYNWPAATAGATRTTNPAGSGNAANSICPANWRMPSGGSDTSSDFAQLDIAFGGTGTASLWVSGLSLASWQPDGVFKGTFSGDRSFGIGGQGNYGNLWSATTH